MSLGSGGSCVESQQRVRDDKMKGVSPIRRWFGPLRLYTATIDVLKRRIVVTTDQKIMRSYANRINKNCRALLPLNLPVCVSAYTLHARKVPKPLFLGLLTLQPEAVMRRRHTSHETQLTT